MREGLTSIQRKSSKTSVHEPKQLMNRRNSLGSFSSKQEKYPKVKAKNAKNKRRLMPILKSKRLSRTEASCAEVAKSGTES